VSTNADEGANLAETRNVPLWPTVTTAAIMIPMRPTNRLDSWKTIASYLNRSVRTVRRWEREEGLPVHRHVHRALGSVYALRSEVDAWRETVARGPSPPSIAVLPFTNAGQDPGDTYLSDGITEEITTILAKVTGLQVTSRTSSMMFRDRSKGAKAIAAQLGVRYLLEGSVRRAADRLRISAQLIDAAKDVHLWAETYDSIVDDIFAIQERLARVIVDALQLRLSAPEEQLIAEQAITHVAAYECYLRARHESWGWRQDSIDKAVELLQEALTIIGDNARLYAALGLAYLQYREAGIDFTERPLLEAELCATKLFSLVGSSASGLQLRGWIRYSRGLIQDAVHDLKAALALEPNNADTLLLLCNCYLISGHVRAARPLLKRLSAVDPLTPLTRCMPAFADIMQGHFAAALPLYRQMFEMDESNPMARLFYAWVLILNGKTQEVDAVVETLPSHQRGSIPAQITLFLALAAQKRQPEAQAVLSDAIEAVAGATDVFSRLLAQGFALMGMRDRALFWLRASIDRGFINYPYLADHDPAFRPLRNDPRFEYLLNSVRERWERFEP
jgi:TolB-like protein